MTPLGFVHSLQLTDAFFPVGAFAYSDGLEHAAAQGRVHDAATLAEWMEHFREMVFLPCEGLALMKCMTALKRNQFDELIRIDEELTAIRPGSAVRAASAGVGKRLLSLYSSICGDKTFSSFVQRLPQCNAAAAYAVVFFHAGLQEREGALAFGYNRLAGIVSAGLRLIPMGHQQGQMLLTQFLDRLPETVDEIARIIDSPLRSFSPVLDIQQMNHQYLYSRLFRS